MAISARVATSLYTAGVITERAIRPPKSPTLPGSRKTGVKPRMLGKVDAASGAIKCPTAVLASAAGAKPPARRLRTSSVMTMALSISGPMAMIMPKTDIWWSC